MTNKHWSINQIIIPILVTVLGGIILLQYDNYFLKESKELDNTVVIKKTQQDIPKYKTNEVKIQATESKKINNLQIEFNIAKKIYGSISRNTAFEKIIKKALKQNNTKLAFDIAQEIYGSISKNTQYIKIIDKCLELKEYELSIKIADDIYGSISRNTQYQKIIEYRK